MSLCVELTDLLTVARQSSSVLIVEGPSIVLAAAPQHDT